jgi:hypothetical protein
MAVRWEGSWIGLAACALLGLVLGCGPEHPAYVDDSAPMNRGGSSSQPDDELNPPDMPSPSIGGKDGGSGPTPGGGPTPGSGSFDPDQVYFSGVLWCGSCSAAAPKPYVASNVNAPDDFVFGFWGEWRGVLWGSDLVYRRDEQIVKFVPDRLGQVAAPEDNDEVVYELDCAGEDPGFSVATPGGRFLYTCGDAFDVYYEDGEQIYDGEQRILRIVTDDLALISTINLGDTEAIYGVLSLSTGEAFPLEDFPLKIDYVWATRAVADGFHIVIQPVYGEASELWNVMGDGSAEKLGTYPVIPGGESRRGVLAADDTYFTSDEVDGASLIITATIGAGDYRVFHTFGADSDRTASGFFTGP